MPKNRGHIASLARSYTETAIKTLAGIMMEQSCPPMARIMAAKVLLDRGWGKPKEIHHSEVDDNKTGGFSFWRLGPTRTASLAPGKAAHTSPLAGKMGHRGICIRLQMNPADTSRD